MKNIVIYTLLVLLVSIAVSGFDNTQPWHDIKQVSHDNGTTGVDNNADGVIDNATTSFSCDGDSTCEMNNANVTSQLGTGEICIGVDCRTAWPTQSVEDVMWTNTSGDATFTTGYVGIGTTNPGGYFSFGKNLVIEGDSPGMTIADNVGTGSGAINWANGTTGSDRVRGRILYQFNGNSMKFATGGQTGLTIRDQKVSIGNTGVGVDTLMLNGNVTFGIFTNAFYVNVDDVKVGVGTRTPEANLDVVGTVNATGDICTTGGNCLSNVPGNPDIMWTNTSGNATFITGFVGIGTEDPVHELWVNGSDNNVQITISNEQANSLAQLVLGGDDQWYVVHTRSDNSFGIRDATNTVDRLVIQNNTGYVGIGTASPEAVLHMAGTGNIAPIIESTDDNAVQLRLRSGSSNRRIVAQNSSANTDTQIQFDGDSIKFIGQTTPADDVMILNSTSGYVGVGTNEPTSPLHIANPGTTDFKIENTNTNQRWMVRNNDNGYLTFVDDVSSKTPFKIYNNSASNTLIVDDGKVGVGITTPDAALDVSGSINATTDVCITGGNCLSTVGGSKQGDEIYLYNDTTTMYLNESKLNDTIDARAGTGIDIIQVAGNLSGTTQARLEEIITLTTPGTLIATGYITGSAASISSVEANIKINDTECGKQLLVVPTGTVTTGLSVSCVKYLESGDHNLTLHHFLTGPGATARTGIQLQYTVITNTTAGTITDNEGIWNKTGSNVYPSELNYKVGIGKANPGEALDVTGQINATVDVCITGGNCLSTVGGSGITENQWENNSDQIFVKNNYPEFINISNTLFINSTSGEIGINTDDLSQKLEVTIPGSTGFAEIRATSYGVSAATNSPFFTGRSARGTKTSPAAVQNGDSLATIGGQGYNSVTGFTNHVPAMINFAAAETWSDTAKGAYMTFHTTRIGDNAAPLPDERMRISDHGFVGINTTTPNMELTVVGDINVTGDIYASDQSVYIGDKSLTNNAGTLEWDNTPIAGVGLSCTTYTGGGTTTVVVACSTGTIIGGGGDCTPPFSMDHSFPSGNSWAFGCAGGAVTGYARCCTIV